MTINFRVKAFAELGTFLRNVSENEQEITSEEALKYAHWHSEFRMILPKIKVQNAWFSPENVIFACQTWGNLLTEDNLGKWCEKYDFLQVNPQKVALILAGNIPLVGFHDLLSVLLSGHSAKVKLSSNDTILLPFLIKKLTEIAPEFHEKVFFITEKLTDFDAVIATGSNNSARYFEYYFSKKPHIIRKNRNSVAVLSGSETQRDLSLLASDIFTYFGLGCRSVSKIFVPENYDFSLFFQVIYPFHDIINHFKYANNYDYNKAVYLMNSINILDNNFFLLKEDTSYGSPIGVLFYEYYNSQEEIKKKLTSESDLLQCIVSSLPIKGAIPFGQTQMPQLSDYADQIDTLEFLINL